MLLSYYFIKEDWNVHGRITVVMNETCSTFPDNFLFAPLNKLEPLNPWCHWGVCVPCCFFLDHYIIDAKYPLAMANFCQKIWLTTFNRAFFPNHVFFSTDPIPIPLRSTYRNCVLCYFASAFYVRSPKLE